MDRILIQKRSKNIREYPLEKDDISIGRLPENDISFPGDPSVSERHAELLRSPDGCLIVDLDSSRGVFVNAKRIRERLLQPGDKITIGDFTLLCLSGDEPNPAEAPEEESLPVAKAPEPVPADPAAEAPAAEPGPMIAAEPEPEFPAVAEAAASEVIPAGPAPEAPAAEAEPSVAPEPAPEVSAEAEVAAPEIIPAEPEPEVQAAEVESVIEAGPAPEIIPEKPAPGSQAAEEADRFAETVSLKAHAEAEPPAPEVIADEPVPEIIPEKPAPGSPAAGEADRFASTSILKAAPEPETPAAEAFPAEPAPESPAAVRDDRFAVTSILKVPKKNKSAPSAASADLEEGVIEIEVAQAPLWSKKRLSKAAILAGTAAGAILILTVMRSAGFRSLLLPSYRIIFNVTPGDAQVYVNGTEMPRPGSGVLRNLPAGTFSVRVSHPGYPAARMMDVETGLFKRQVEVDSAPGGISTK